MGIFFKSMFCFCLSLVLFTGCDENIDDSEVGNPVLGVWNNYYENTDSLLMTRVFTSDFYSYFTFADGRTQSELNKQRYTVNETHISLEKYTQTYTLEKDTLWITNKKGDQTTKYIRAYLLPLE